MSEDTENHTIRLLQELRSDMREMRQEMNSRFEDTNLRIDGLSHMMMLLAGNVGGHHDRIEALEERLDTVKSD